MPAPAPAALFSHLNQHQWACVELAKKRDFEEKVEILDRMSRFESVGAASAMVAAFARAGAR